MTVAGFLARYRGATRTNYQSDLRCYLGWCDQVDMHPLDVTRPQLEVWVRHMGRTYPLCSGSAVLPYEMRSSPQVASNVPVAISGSSPVKTLS